jgi:hypothetical protein
VPEDEGNDYDDVEPAPKPKDNPRLQQRRDRPRNDAEQRAQFLDWFHSEAHRAYIDKVRENDGNVLDDEEAAWILSAAGGDGLIPRPD